MAHEENSQNPRLPSFRHTLLEIPRAAAEVASLALSHRNLKSHTSGDRHPVMVVPPFAVGRRSTLVLERYIRHWGYDVQPWKHGVNLDASKVRCFSDVKTAMLALVDSIAEELTQLHEKTGQRSTLVGWSLGGLLATLTASSYPDVVRRVVTLGTPHGDLRSVVVYPVMKRIGGNDVSDEDLEEWALMCKSPLNGVPTTIIHSDKDGFVAPEIATRYPEPGVEHVHVDSSHIGFAMNPKALRAVAKSLAQEESPGR